MINRFFLVFSLFALCCVCQQFDDENGCHYDLSGLESVASSILPNDVSPSLLAYDGVAVDERCPGVQLRFDSSLPCSDSGDTKTTLINVACDSTSELTVQASKKTNSCVTVLQVWSKFACASDTADGAVDMSSSRTRTKTPSRTRSGAPSPSSTPSRTRAPSPSNTPSRTPSRSLSRSSNYNEYSASRTRTPSPFLSATKTPSQTRNSAVCNAFAVKGLEDGETVTVFGSTANQPIALYSSCTSHSTGTAWYVITPGTYANVTIATCGTNFDNQIGVFSGSCNSPQCLYYAQSYDDDDNGNNPCNYGATLQFMATETQYYVSVQSTYGVGGNFEITFSSTGGSDPSCATAASIPGPYLEPFTLAGSSDTATNSSIVSCGLTSSSKGVWYRINPQIGAPLTISTCNKYTDFNTEIAVFTGTCSDLSCQLVSVDNCTTSYGLTTSEIYFTPTNSSYYVVVHGRGSESGYYQLSLSQSSPQIDSPCGTASPLTIQNSRNIIVSGTTTGALQFPSYDNICGGEIGSTVWFKISNPTYQSFVTFSTCYNTNFDTILYLYSGENCHDLYCHYYNDDFCQAQSQFTTEMSAGDYYLAVAGYNGETGDFQLSITTST